MHKGMMCLVKERLKDCRTSTTDYGGEHVERRVCTGRREGGREKGRETCFMYSLQIAIMSLFYRYFMSSGHG